MKSLREFMDQFKFNPEKDLFVGVERECHLLNKDDVIVPIAEVVLQNLPSHNGQFTYELSACQLEWRIGPCELSDFAEEFKRFEVILTKAEKQTGFKRSFAEVAPDDMPLDVYPDPTGRYQQITKDMPKEILSAACRVIATHVHIGMPNPEVALETYNKAIQHFDELCGIGDHSDGQRLSVYKIMAPSFLSPYYKSWNDFYNKAVKEGFVDDPRSCWTLIRISKHGTIEFRMFGATADLEEIMGWVNLCYEICQ